jgi:hypothetical protein
VEEEMERKEKVEKCGAHSSRVREERQEQAYKEGLRAI